MQYVSYYSIYYIHIDTRITEYRNIGIDIGV